MTRLVKPDATQLQIKTKQIADSGDGVWTGVVGGMVALGSVCFGIPLSIMEDPSFLILLLPTLIFLFGLFAYLTGTADISYRDANHYTDALRYMNKMKGTFVESYARPIVEQIYQHSIERHPGVSYGNDCSLCQERLDVLKELTPRRAQNKSDIEQARLFIEERKKYEIEA